ncbi:MAG: hypothetical protein AAF744_11010 [Pseudomonadota bacterium]
MKRAFFSLAVGASLAACGGTPPFGVEPGADESVNSTYLTEANAFMTLNNISYDPATDTLNLNNIPFDDPNNNYERITTENFSNGFDAYTSAPARDSNEIEYFAIFRRSDSGQSQVAAAGTDGYIDFGFGGAGAQRLGAKPTLPTSGVYSYTGEYAAVRTTRPNTPTATNPDRTEFVTGTANLAADFGDFDNVGAVGGTITNRTVYDTSGNPIGALDGFISLANAEIDFENAVIGNSTAVEINGAGNQVGSGTWNGVFAGPGGNEIAGVLFIEGSEVQETGGFVVTQ